MRDHCPAPAFPSTESVLDPKRSQPGGSQPGEPTWGQSTLPAGNRPFASIASLLLRLLSSRDPTRNCSSDLTVCSSLGVKNVGHQ